MDDSIAIPEEPSFALPPVPRPVIARPGAHVWLPWLGLVPHTLVGIGLAGVVLTHILWALVGVEVPGQVIAKSAGHGRGRSHNHVSYFYEDVDSHPHEGLDDVSVDEYHRLTVGDAFRVRTFDFGPIHFVHGTEDPVLYAPPLAGMALLWNTFVGLALYQEWYLSLLEAWLLKNGVATAGVVVATRTSRGRRGAVLSYARYAFHDARGARRECEALVREATLGGTVRVEQPLTILFALDRPQQSIPYEYAVYSIAGVN